MSDAQNGCNPLLRLPPEILELIVLNVVGVSNLLSLGLTSRLFAQLVFPRHIQYHTVRASLRHVYTWQHLIRNRSCARNVRCLQVIHDSHDSSSFSGPIHFQLDNALDTVEYSNGDSEQSELECDLWRERLLVLALQGMSNLRSFVWLRSCPPINSGDGDIWSALRKKEHIIEVSLRELKMSAPNYAVTQGQPEELHIRSLLVSPIATTFFGLVKFELECHPISLKGPMTILSTVDLLVSHCHNLETLRIWLDGPTGRYPDFDDLFILGRWPKLRSLQLICINVSPTHSMSMALGTFLSFHRVLSHLEWDVRIDDYGNPVYVILLPHSLPRLSYLNADDQMTKSTLSLPCSPRRPLGLLYGLCLDQDFWEQARHNLQGIDMYSLRAVKVTSIQRATDLRLLAVSFPNIEYLDLEDIDMEDEVWDEDTESTRALLTAEWVEKLYPLRNLRALYGASFLLSPSGPLAEENDERIKWLAILFPHLESFDDWSSESVDGAVEIVRGVNGPAWRKVPNRWNPFSAADPPPDSSW